MLKHRGVHAKQVQASSGPFEEKRGLSSPEEATEPAETIKVSRCKACMIDTIAVVVVSRRLAEIEEGSMPSECKGIKMDDCRQPISQVS
jgi:hypothetical protein